MIEQTISNPGKTNYWYQLTIYEYQEKEIKLIIERLSQELKNISDFYVCYFFETYFINNNPVVIFTIHTCQKLTDDIKLEIMKIVSNCSIVTNRDFFVN